MSDALEELLGELPEARRNRVLAETNRLCAAYRALLEAARMAKREGLPLSDLRDHVEDNGGKLSVVVEFPGLDPVDLVDVDDVDGSNASRPERDIRDTERQAGDVTARIWRQNFRAKRKKSGSSQFG